MMMPALLLLLVLDIGQALDEARKIWGSAAQVWQTRFDHQTVDGTATQWEYCIGFQPLMGTPQKAFCSTASFDEAFQKFRSHGKRTPFGWIWRSK